MWFRIILFNALLFALSIPFQNCGPGFKVSEGLKPKVIALDSTLPPVDGKALYAQNCASCHGALENSVKSRRTAEQISTAIGGGVPQMAALPNLKALTSQQVGAIAKALDMSPPQVITCTGSQELQTSPSDLQRLTKVQLTNTYKDLLPDDVFQLVQPLLTSLPEENLADSVDRFNPSYTLTYTEALMNLATQASQALTATDQRLNQFLSRHSSCMNFQSVTDACVLEFIRRLGLRVFRRPLTSNEVLAHETLFASGGDTKDRFQLLLMTMLQSPEMLYHFEFGETSQGTNTEFNISSYELASRLSYGMWDSMPSESMWAWAEGQQILDPVQRNNLVQQMLTQPRTKEKAVRFLEHWLGLARVPGTPTNAIFLKGINTSGLRDEMIRETLQYLDHVIWQRNGSYQTLLTSDVSFARTPALASIYGHALAADPNAGTQVMATERQGLLLRAPFLISSEDKTHPLVRGAALRRRILCDSLGAPDPAAIGSSPELDTVQAIQQYSQAERLALKTKPAQCTSCHAQINPLGFALESFDSLGRFRTTEINYDSNEVVISQHLINPSVSNLNIEVGAPNASLSAKEFTSIVAASEKGPACFAKQIFRFYRLRSEVADDHCVVSAGSQAARVSLWSSFGKYFSHPSIVAKKVKP